MMPVPLQLTYAILGICASIKEGSKKIDTWEERSREKKREDGRGERVKRKGDWAHDEGVQSGKIRVSATL